jgi:hypothetical protein
MNECGFIETFDDYKMFNADSVAELTEQILKY